MNRQTVGCRGAAQAVRTNSDGRQPVRTAHPTHVTASVEGAHPWL
jgi:hypothetical protein